MKKDWFLLGSIVIAYLPSTYLDVIYIPILLFVFFSYKKQVNKMGFIQFLSFSLVSFFLFGLISINYHTNVLSYLIRFSSYLIFFLPLFIRKYQDEQISVSTLKAIQLIYVLESVIGIVQFIEAALFRNIGTDSVEGTISLSFGSAAGLTHQSFVLTQIILTLILVYHRKANLRYKNLTIIIGTLSIILASVVHMLFSLAIAIVLILFLNLLTKKLLDSAKRIVLSLVLLAVVFGTAYQIFTTNIRLIIFYSKLAQEQSVQLGKLNAINGGISEIKETPLLFLSGFGLGQYNSRASLLVAGDLINNYTVNQYLTNPAFGSESGFYKDHIKKWVEFQKNKNYAWGSTGSPSSSLVSLIFESGFILLTILFSFLIRYINSANPKYRELIRLLVIFLFIVSFQENYLELVTQFAPVFVIIGRYSKLN